MEKRSTCPCCGSNDLVGQPAIIMPFIVARVFEWEPTYIDRSWGLKDVPEGTTYMPCTTLYCRACTHVFPDIEFSDSELARLYRGYRSEEYNSERCRFEPGYRARCDEINLGYSYIDETERFIEQSIVLSSGDLEILDWGGGDGRNTPFRHRDGCSVCIYDEGSRISDYANIRFIDQSQLYKHSFSLVTCINVLEHVSNPILIQQEICSYMSVGQKIFFEVPLESFRAEDNQNDWKSKRHWHEHIHCYSLKSFIESVSRSGFNIIKQRVLSTLNNEREERLIQVLAQKS